MRLMPPRLGSLSSIHDDDPAAHISYHTGYEDNSSRAHERRNAFVFNYDSSGSVIMEEDLEKPTFERPPIPSIVLERLQQQSSGGKRNSEPIYYEGGYDPYPNSHLAVMPDDGTKIYGTRVLYPSTDRISKSESGTLYRNSEPTIMIHSASNDFDSSFELEDIQSQCSNGLVFVRKVTNEDGSVDRYYINERPAQSFNQQHRASLSKVSYVPSGNMNDYYHNCLHSPNRTKPDIQRTSEESGSTESKSDEKSKSAWPWKKPGGKKTAEIEVPNPLNSRRGRLSLGDIAVSNFNRRIVDFPSESLGSTHDSDNDATCNKVSKDQTPAKPATAWRRLKNVFSGSRSSQSSVTKMKQMKTMQSSEERVKRGGRRTHGKWNRFVSVLMGFRTFPESRRSKAPSLQNNNSKSLPMGLDKQARSTEEFDFHRSYHAISFDSHNAHYVNKFPEHPSFFSRFKKRMMPPPGMRAPPKTQSFPEDILKNSTDSSQFVYPSPRRNILPSLRQSGRKYKRKHASYESYTRPRSHSDAHHYYHLTSSQSSGDDPYYKHYQNMSTMSSPRSKSPLFAIFQDSDGVYQKNRDRRYKSLSPLPERWFKSMSRRKSHASRSHSHSERSSFSERGKSVLPYLAYSADFAFPLGLIDKQLRSDRLPGNDKTTLPPVPKDKSANKSLQSSANNIEHLDYTLGANHVDWDHSKLTKYRHSLSGPMFNVNSATDNAHSDQDQVMNSDNIDKSFEKEKLLLRDQKKAQTLTLDVDPKVLANSMDSVYFDTVSILGSPANSLKQSTTPTTPMDKNESVELEIHSPDKSYFSTNSKGNMSRESTMPSSSLENPSRFSNCNGSATLAQGTDQQYPDTSLSEILVDPHDTFGEFVGKVSGQSDEQGISKLNRNAKPKFSILSSMSLQSPSSPPAQIAPRSRPRINRVSFESQPSTISSTSLEDQSSVTSSSSLCSGNKVKTVDDLLHQSLDLSLEGVEEDRLLLPQIGGDSPSLLFPLTEESSITSPKHTEAPIKNFPLDLPTFGSASFEIVSETGRKNSSENPAIFNLTRLPRFGRRASQCTSSPLSESRPGRLFIIFW